MKTKPDKWLDIQRIALDLGASNVSTRLWLHRGRIPSNWKLRIFEATNGAISLSQMDWRDSEVAQ